MKDEKDLSAALLPADQSASVKTEALPNAVPQRRYVIDDRSALSRLAAVAAMAALSGPVPNAMPRIGKGPTPNKYQPHQGAREKARRARRSEAP